MERDTVVDPFGPFMIGKARTAFDIYRRGGPDELVITMLEYGRTEVVPWFLSREPVDRACLDRSLAELSERRRDEETLEDILNTTGYRVVDRDAYNPEKWTGSRGVLPGWGAYPGLYTGYGLYESLEMLQERESILKFARAVRAEEPRTVVEIGSANGGTFYLWNRYLDSAETLISVDQTFPGRRPAFFDGFEPTTKTHCIEGDILSTATTSAVHRVLGGSTIDFLYIDLPHDYDLFKRAYENFEHLVADDGVVGMHDISQPWSDVRHLWEEMQDEHRSAEYGSGPVNNGLLWV